SWKLRQNVSRETFEAWAPPLQLVDFMGTNNLSHASHASPLSHFFVLISEGGAPASENASADAVCLTWAAARLSDAPTFADIRNRCLRHPRTRPLRLAARPNCYSQALLTRSE